MFSLPCLSKSKSFVNVNPWKNLVICTVHSKKIEGVEKDSNELWRYQRFRLVTEYKEKAGLPPPFSILWYLAEIILWCYRKLSCKPHQGADNKKNTEPIVNETHDSYREKIIGELHWQRVFEEENIKKM